MLETISQPWPWYVAGPLIGLMVPTLILLKRRFGISTSLRHACAATAPRSASFFDYDWRSEGGWNLVFVAGVFLGGILSAVALPGPEAVNRATRRGGCSVGGLRPGTGARGPRAAATTSRGPRLR